MFLIAMVAFAAVPTYGDDGEEQTDMLTPEQAVSTQISVNGEFVKGSINGKEQAIKVVTKGEELQEQGDLYQFTATKGKTYLITAKNCDLYLLNAKGKVLKDWGWSGTTIYKAPKDSTLYLLVSGNKKSKYSLLVKSIKPSLAKVKVTITYPACPSVNISIKSKTAGFGPDKT
jgi:hypothetical protein